MNAYANRHDRFPKTKAIDLKAEEAKERVRKLCAETVQSLRAYTDSQNKGFKPEMPLSPGQAGMYRAMLALPDARDVTEEHRQRRRKIGTKLEATQ